jgi:hypothetical protein
MVGGMLSRAGTGFADPGADSIAHDLQLVLLIAGAVVYIVVSALAARRGHSFALGLLAGIIAGVLGAVMGTLITIGASYVATDSEVNYLVALGGDVSFAMGQAGATGTAIFYGIVGVLFGVVQGVVCGLIGGLAGKVLATGSKKPVSA